MVKRYRRFSIYNALQSRRVRPDKERIKTNSRGRTVIWENTVKRLATSNSSLFTHVSSKGIHSEMCLHGSSPGGTSSRVEK